jgi:hypothetical protein
MTTKQILLDTFAASGGFEWLITGDTKAFLPDRELFPAAFEAVAPFDPTYWINHYKLGDEYWSAVVTANYLIVPPFRFNPVLEERNVIGDRVEF